MRLIMKSYQLHVTMKARQHSKIKAPPRTSFEPLEKIQMSSCTICQEDGHKASRCPHLGDPLKEGFQGGGGGGGGHDHDDDEGLTLKAPHEFSVGISPARPMARQLSLKSTVNRQLIH